MWSNLKEIAIQLYVIMQNQRLQAQLSFLGIFLEGGATKLSFLSQSEFLAGRRRRRKRSSKDKESHLIILKSLATPTYDKLAISFLLTRVPSLGEPTGHIGLPRSPFYGSCRGRVHEQRQPTHYPQFLSRIRNWNGTAQFLS